MTMSWRQHHKYRTGITTSANKVEIIWPFCLSVCVSLCEHDYWKSNEPISLKLGVMIGPSNRKNLLAFGWAPVPDTDSE